jgi:2,3-dihydroxybenzoate decarboxylase
MKLIALEEAFAIPALTERHPAVIDAAACKPAPWFRGHVGERLTDVAELRLKDMDDNGVDIQVLSLTTPGIQASLAPPMPSPQPA